MIRKKILLLGDFNVGKTSLIRRYVDNAFDDKYLSTIGVKISKKLCIIQNIECEFLIWDIEGETPTKKIPLSYYKGASGAIFVADVNRCETFENLVALQEVFISENPDASFVTAYNKVDLLSPTQREKFTCNSDSFLTSAKLDENVEKLFTTLMQKIL